MKHLRVALEDAESLENGDVIGTLGENAEALAAIADDLPDVGEEAVSLESAIRISSIRLPSTVAAMARYRTAMESDAAAYGIAAAVLAAIAAVIALVAKVMHHFFGGKSKGGGGGGGSPVQNTSAQVDKVAEVGGDWEHQVTNLEGEIRRSDFEVEGKKVRSVQELYLTLDESLRERDWVAHRKNSQMIKMLALLDEKHSPLMPMAKAVMKASAEHKRLIESFPPLEGMSVYHTRELTTRLQAITATTDVSFNGKQTSISDLVEDLREAYNADVSPGAMPESETIVEIAKSVIGTLSMPSMKNVLAQVAKAEELIKELEAILVDSQNVLDKRADEMKDPIEGNLIHTENLFKAMASMDKNVSTLIRAQINMLKISMKWIGHLISDAEHIDKIYKAMKVTAKKYAADDSKIVEMLDKLPELKLK